MTLTNKFFKLIHSKEDIKKFLVIVTLIFVPMIGTGQSKSLLPKNNCFNDITRDSILSKLYDRKFLRERQSNLVMTLRRSDSTIIDYAYKSHLQSENERLLRDVIRKKDSIINSKNMIFHLEKKKKKKTIIKWSLIGLGTGFVTSAIILK